MGQASVELPEAPDAAAATGGNADDLLSQLAGEEIDRLLAEENLTDTGATPAAAAELAAPEPQSTDGLAAPAEPSVDTSALDASPTDPAPSMPDASSADASAPDPTAANVTGAASAVAEEELSTQLNELFEALTKEPEQTEATHAPSAEPAQSSAAAVAAEMNANKAERAALAEPAREPLEATPHAASGKLPFYLLPLAWINAPFASLPPATRDLLGKVAIVTSINTVAMLIYVIVFRK